MKKKHILMITNHGVHEWEVHPGIQDTGGQNIYVNQLTDTLAEAGFRVTIANRGGYPHPETGEMRTGERIRDENRKIIYLEDDRRKFVRKEDMKPQIPELTDFLYSYLENNNEKIDLIISHYWDAGYLGVLLNGKLSEPVPHLWIPHSLGEIKKRNVDERRWEELKIAERINTEHEMINKFDHVVATSALIRDSLKNDYGREAELFLPPCIRTERFYPRSIKEDNAIWDYLSMASGKPPERMRSSRFIIEISRTDKTKQKSVLLKAFASFLKKSGRRDVFLIISIEKQKEKLYGELQDQIDMLKIRSRVLTIGFEADRLPLLYALSSVYCSPSIMEGFGMSVQEAAACSVPAVGSRHIPFVTEYLAKRKNESDSDIHGSDNFRIGPAGIVVQRNDPEVYADALQWILEDEDRRKAMGQKAYEITIPAFTWRESTKRLLDKVNLRNDL